MNNEMLPKYKEISWYRFNKQFLNKIERNYRRGYARRHADGGKCLIKNQLDLRQNGGKSC